jgi:hypothetical protein
MSGGLNAHQVTNSPVVVAAAWVGSMLLVFGTSARASFLLSDLWCTREGRIAAENFFSRPIPGTKVLTIIGGFAAIYLAAQWALYGNKSVSGLIRSLPLIPVIVLMLFMLQLFTGMCGVESHFLNRYGNVFIIAICFVFCAVLTAFAFYIVPEDIASSTRCGQLMAATFLIANAGTLLALVQLGAVVFVRGWQ